MASIFEQNGKRNYLPVSSVSLLGSCETKVYESLMGGLKVTKRMQIGKVGHEKLVEKLPKLDKEEMFKIIKSGAKCSFREVPVLDEKLKMIGRMDEIRFEAGVGRSKRPATLIDDKFTKAQYSAIPLYYKLQLALYTCAVDNSEDFSKLCNINKAVLICREQGTGKIMKTLEADSQELDVWRSNTPAAVSYAWDMYSNNKQPQHRRFDVVTGQWAKCWCDKN
jgi:hypothetical protein